MFERIETTRLVLRELKEEDAEDIFRIWDAEENRRFYSDRSTLESVKKLCAAGEFDRYGRVWRAVLLKEKGNKLIGTCKFKILENGYWEVGYNFDSDFWGHGFATEAIKEGIFELGNRHGAKGFVACADKRNLASLRVIEKCGLKFARFDEEGDPEFEISGEELFKTK